MYPKIIIDSGSWKIIRYNDTEHIEINEFKVYYYAIECIIDSDLSELDKMNKIKR